MSTFRLAFGANLNPWQSKTLNPYPWQDKSPMVKPQISTGSSPVFLAVNVRFTVKLGWLYFEDFVPVKNKVKYKINKIYECISK